MCLLCGMNWIFQCNLDSITHKKIVVPWLRLLLAGFSPRRPWYDPSLIHVRFMGFLLILRCSHTSTISPVLCTPSACCACTERQRVKASKKQCCFGNLGGFGRAEHNTSPINQSINQSINLPSHERYMFRPGFWPSSGMSTQEYMQEDTILYVFSCWHARRWPKFR